MKKQTKHNKKKKNKKNKFFYIIPIATLMAIAAVLIVFVFKDDRVGDCGNHDKQGIDVSHHQGAIDWNRLAAAGDIKFAYIKATEGATHKDTRYHINMQQAREVGILVGSYHYFHPNVAVEKQFANFVDIADPSMQDLIPVIDIEERGKKSNHAICDSLSKFMKLIASHYGVEPIIYTGQSYYNKILKDRFKKNRLWIARYGILKFKIRPRLNNEQECNIWQYSNRGRVEGIKGYVDLNTLCGNMEIEEIMIKK